MNGWLRTVLIPLRSVSILCRRHLRCVPPCDHHLLRREGQYTIAGPNLARQPSVAL